MTRFKQKKKEWGFEQLFTRVLNFFLAAAQFSNYRKRNTK